MTNKQILVFTLFLFSHFPVSVDAHDKTVVIPLGGNLKADSLRAICRGYEDIGEVPPAKYNCPNKLVFVTSQSFNGNLGGWEGANAKCQQLADTNASLNGRKFKAWISHLGTSPRSSFIKSHTPYYEECLYVTGPLFGTKRVNIVANDWNDLVDQMGNISITITEVGICESTMTGVNVWTGTNEAGGLWNYGDDDNCNNWTSSSSTHLGNYGTTSTGNWSRYIWFGGCGSCDSLRCNNEYHLYCFEQ